MAITATKISTDFEPVNCVDLERGGVAGVVYGINYADWLNATVTREAITGAISAIVLTETGTKAVKYSLTRGAMPTAVEAAINNGGKSGLIHSVPMFLPSKDATLRAEVIGSLNFNRMVWIVVLDSTIVSQVFGNDVGLSITGITEANVGPDKGGGFDAIFSTPADVTSENLLPVEFFDTDRVTTLAALEALLTPVV